MRPVSSSARRPRPRLRMRYEPARCRLRGIRVWAIRTRQPDGTWRIVNCLDKGEDCFGHQCIFTTPGGHWPYPPQNPIDLDPAIGMIE